MEKGREQSVKESVLGGFKAVKRSLESQGMSPQNASRRALEQALLQLRDFGPLNQSQSLDIARALKQAEGDRLREIVSEFKKGKFGDPVDQNDYSNPKIMRVLAAAKRLT